MRGTRVALAAALVVVGATVFTTSAAEPGSVFVPVTPTRVLDTRTAVGLPGLLTSDQPATLVVTGPVAVVNPDRSTGVATVVPTGATGIVANVTAVTPTALGYVSVRPGTATGLPSTSSLNVVADQTVPNSVTVSLPADGTVNLWYHGGVPGATTHLLVDIVGYYAPGSGSAGPAGPPGAAGQDGADGATGPAGPAGPVNRISDAQIALLRWYEDPGRAATVAVGARPFGVAYDGTRIWVANFAGDTVSRIDAATGTVIGTPIPVGDQPGGIAYDGTHVWVANYWGNSVTRIDAAGTVVGAPVPVGTNPIGVAYDGSTIWVANSGSDNVTRINPVTATAVNPPIAVGDVPYDIAHDGTMIWVTNLVGGALSRIDPVSGTAGPIAVGGSNLTRLAYDGDDLWITRGVTNDVIRVDPASGAPVGAPIPVGASPYGIVFDGTNLWVANSDADTVSKVLP